MFYLVWDKATKTLRFYYSTLLKCDKITNTKLIHMHIDCMTHILSRAEIVSMDYSYLINFWRSVKYSKEHSYVTWVFAFVMRFVQGAAGHMAGLYIHVYKMQ